MAGMKTLKTLIDELEHQLAVCIRCGMCQAVCPLFAETGREADVARGKMALLDGLAEELFKDPGEVSERIEKCLLCGSCAANCPGGVSVLEVFLKARVILSGFMGLSPAKRIIFRGVLARPNFFERLLERGAKFQHLVTRQADPFTGTSCARFMPPLLSRRHFMPLAPVPFHRSVPSLNPDSGHSGITAALFVGCLIDKIFPRIALDTRFVLDHHGVGVFLPGGQGCCGIPALSAGDAKTFGRLVRHNLQRLETNAFDYLITPCATCTWTIKTIWPLMAGGDNADLRRKIDGLAAKTLDIHQFLVSVVGLEKAPVENRTDAAIATYHDPCHLKKSLGVSEEPRAVVTADPAYRLEEMSEPDRCCGLGGAFNLEYYGLSMNIGRKKRDSILATGCRVVAAGCPACMLQLSDVLSQTNEKIVVKHPIEIYAAFLKRQNQ